ncbi:MAG TPA: AsmA family protein, partial [Candidatus Binatia bacterium]|nr:AsmA family protein [Candidatus Binatia bacterium]
MRKWIIVGAVLLSLGAILVLALVNLNSLINRNKTYLLDQAQQALGRKVSVGEAEVTLWGGVGIRLKNFTMSDDPAFSSGDFVRAKDLQVNLKLLPLLRREFQIKRLILHDPVIQIVRNRDGRFNFSTIGKEKKDREKKPDAEEKEKQRKTAGLLVSMVNISGGDVHYVDRKEG